MKVVICNTVSDEPEVHAPGCADVVRGFKQRKYHDKPWVVEVERPEEAAHIFWADFLPDGCAYEEAGPGSGLTYDQAEQSTKFLPCLDALKNLAQNASESPAPGVGSGASPANQAGITQGAPMATGTASKTSTTRKAPATHGRSTTRSTSSLSAPAPRRSNGTPAGDDKDLLNGVSSPRRATPAARVTPTKAAAARAGTPKTTSTTKAPAKATPTKASPAKAAPAKAKATAGKATPAERTPAPAPEPKVSKNDAKHDLAALIVRAVGKEIASGDGSAVWETGFSQEEAARQVSQWLHYLPFATVDGKRVWPTDSGCPVPDRSDWR